MRCGTVVIWNDAIVDRLKEQYGVDDKRDDVTEKTEILGTKKNKADSIFGSS